MIDINNIPELEHAFAEDFSTPVFPVLADHYLKNKEMKRARQVCEVGLQHDPYNTDGKFILAKINLYENKLKNGEQLLKQVVDENPVHVNGLRILIEVMRYIKRSPNSIQKYIHRLLDVLPNDEDALVLLTEIEQSIQPKIKKTTRKKTKSKKDVSTKKVAPEKPKKEKQETPVFNIGVSMATFTMVGVLRSQKNYK